ncbi:methyltransferase domain-containing protein [Paenibacillus silagei]|uniref:Ubiquinone/menaquinone biosynthesis C-methylase UbiE n=1 Tax=Paenibacillus silagei TaxID=1670801 RepID=A0ABS4NMJ8_9BACL|nr:methyltransferase domain-containing protein [Paenibacillus silagei]MBP2110577.1 ubiquinone/menaquinone biosynthesis C-methylase UbiE [Paenibacillus silagei]
MSREIKLDLSRIVFIGRTFEEYKSMFNLTQRELKGRSILDCPAGACSFTAHANKQGADVTATDIAYFHDYEDLHTKGLKDLEHAMTKMESAQTNYVWDYFQSVDELKQHRSRALTDCAEDMKNHPGRYIASALPSLPFKDKQFDMTLSAHFLFMYSDRLDFDFHRQAIQELLRVTKQEIRIFPLVSLTGERYRQLDELLTFLHQQGCSTEEITAGYEFQKGANSRLKITL